MFIKILVFVCKWYSILLFVTAIILVAVTEDSKFIQTGFWMACNSILVFIIYLSLTKKKLGEYMSRTIKDF
jgi:hypothetical protein